jgi:hypothetical protein
MKVKTVCFCSDFILHISFVAFLLSYDAYIPLQSKVDRGNAAKFNEGRRMVN